MSRDELLSYYERELHFIRRLAREFAEKYPQVGGRLQLEPTKCEDPHVERLIEAFALLTARIHLRLDDELADVTDALMGIVYPHLLRPVPSMTVVQMTVDPDEGGVEGGFEVPRHSVLHSRPVSSVRCQFRTAYPTRLYPIEIESVEVERSLAGLPSVPDDARSALRITLKTVGGLTFADMAPESLRLFLDAAGGDVHGLYELFLRDPKGLLVAPVGAADESAPGAVFLPPTAIRPVGFSKDEGLLEYGSESFLGYRLLQEYFSFPEKFLFVDLAELRAAMRRLHTDRVQIMVLLPDSPAQLDVRVDRDNIKLGCTPAINLFSRPADPIRMTQTAVEYAVQPDARSPNVFEVHSITGVSSTQPGTARSVQFQPFFGIQHGGDSKESEAFWFARRRPSMRKGDAGSDVFISIVDPDFDPLSAPVDVLNVDTLCTNRGLPAMMSFGDSQGDFHLEGRPGVSKIVAIRKPTDPLPAPVATENRWRLISHLALNHLSLVDADGAGGQSGGALEGLQEILRLYDFRDSPVTRQTIGGLVGLKARRIVRRVGAGATSGFARGMEIDLEFDPTQYSGQGVFLFASVLDRFLSLYASVNSFTETVVRQRQIPGVFKRWQPRAGEMAIL